MSQSLIPRVQLKGWFFSKAGPGFPRAELLPHAHSLLGPVRAYEVLARGPRSGPATW